MIIKKIIKKASAAIFDYNMINKGDSVAVGVSGGKDSLVLLRTLIHTQKYHKLNFRLCAITVDPFFDGKKTDYSEITDFCNKNNIEHIIEETRLYDVIFEQRKEKNPCSLCAKMRRGILVNSAKTHGFNKIALGHHKDDAVQTFLMNILDGGRIGCFSPKSYLSRKDIWVIRPLIYCLESEVASACRRYCINTVKSSCPVDGKTERGEIGELLSLLRKDYSDIDNKIIGAMKRAGLNEW